MNKLWMDTEKGRVLVTAMKQGSDLWIHVNGRTLLIESEQKQIGGKTGAKTTSDQIKAPMPGKVTKVLRKVGETVKHGDPVLVLEAMKMEYTLKSEMDGEIIEIQAKAGELVPLGTTLVKMKESGK